MPSILSDTFVARVPIDCQKISRKKVGNKWPFRPSFDREKTACFSFKIVGVFPTKSHQWILAYLPHYSENFALAKQGYDRHPWLDFSLSKTKDFSIIIIVAPATPDKLFKNRNILACKTAYFE